MAAFLIGVPWVFLLENLTLHFNLYAYTQTTGTFVLRSGSLTQYPVAMCLVMGAYFAALVAVVKAPRSGSPARNLATTTALVSALYVGSMVPFALARTAGWSSHQSTPQPYADVAPYDPDGLAGRGHFSVSGSSSPAN